MPDTPSPASYADRIRAQLPFGGPDLDEVLAQLDERGLEVLAVLVEAPAMIEQRIRARVMLELVASSPEEGGPFDTHTATVEGQTPQGPGMTRDPAPLVERTDKYTVRVEGHSIRATPDQESRIRDMDAADRARFLKIMGKRDA